MNDANIDQATFDYYASIANTPGMGASGIGVALPSIAGLPSIPKLITLEELYTNVLGREASPEELASWNFGATVDAGELDRFLGAARNEVVETRPTSGAVGKIAQQILDQGTTDKWGGEGFGSAQKNAYDMAAMLAGQGITDINQFGKISVPTNAAVTPVYELGPVQDPDGEYISHVITGYTDESGKSVDPSLVRAMYDEDGSVGYFAPVGKKEVFGNKATGQPIQAYYDKAQGNTWGGTFAGKGSTAYKVNFQDGVPVFYTQFGGSSNTLVNIIGDNKLLMIAANVGAAYLGGPAGVGALQAAMGKDIGDIAKSMALTYVGGQVSGAVSGSQAVIDTLGQAGANIAGNAAGAIATGKDPLAAIATGGFGKMVGEYAGFEGTTASTIGSSLVKGVVAEIRGQDVTDAMLAGAVSGYLSGEKDVRLAKKAAAEDIAGGLIPEYGTNEAYDNFMQGAMTPEAMASIENQFGLNKPADEDIAGGLIPEYGTNKAYDEFMKDAMTPEAQASIEDMISNFGTDTTAGNTAATDTGFDATEREGSLAKDNKTGDGFLSKIFEPMSGADALKTGIKAGLAGTAVAAGGAAVNSLVTRPTTTTTSTDGIDIYKDAPIKGYHMKQDPITGRYIPYIGERALLAKGGFVTRR